MQGLREFLKSEWPRISSGIGVLLVALSFFVRDGWPGSVLLELGAGLALAGVIFRIERQMDQRLKANEEEQATRIAESERAQAARIEESERAQADRMESLQAGVEAVLARSTQDIAESALQDVDDEIEELRRAFLAEPTPARLVEITDLCAEKSISRAVERPVTDEWRLNILAHTTSGNPRVQITVRPKRKAPLGQPQHYRIYWIHQDYEQMIRELLDVWSKSPDFDASDFKTTPWPKLMVEPFVEKLRERMAPTDVP